jgi:hypothetical protein
MSTRITLTQAAEKTDINHRYLHHLGKDVYLFDSVLQRNVYIHVRKLIKGEYPTKDGISLTLQRCNELIISVPFLDQSVNMIKFNQDTFYRRHIRGNWHATLQGGFKCVDIRQFWLPEGAKEICSSKKGISLNFDQYKELTNGLRAIKYYVTELDNIVPCYDDPKHCIESCSECTPK